MYDIVKFVNYIFPKIKIKMAMNLQIVLVMNLQIVLGMSLQIVLNAFL